MKIRRIFAVSACALLLTVAGWTQSPQKAKVFTVTANDAGSADMAKFRDKVVLLTFWSTRCSICRNEIPKLNLLADVYAGRDVVFLAASTENDNVIESYLRDHPFGFKILPNSFGLMLRFAPPDREGRVNIAYPAYYLIDRTGRVRYHDFGWDKTQPIAEAIDSLLANR